jgi:two-component system, OmpR family, alkaline phosphatase synthesis response regulator PhoP
VEPILIYPDPPPPELAQALDLGGYAWRAVNSVSAVDAARGTDVWSAMIALIGADPDDDTAFEFCQAVRAQDVTIESVLLLVPGTRIAALAQHHELFADFCLWPIQPREFEARLAHLFFGDGSTPGGGLRPDLVEYGPLILNMETYQAVVDGQPLDLTYMEYELLKFLAQHPGKVFTRETLLSRVWGYDYYGGARTVDVHIRRLRAKLTEEHAPLIQTVRSVGYRFGQSRWGM